MIELCSCLDDWAVISVFLDQLPLITLIIFLYWFIHLDVSVDMLDTIDLTKYLGLGLQLHEEQLPEDDVETENQAAVGMFLFVVHFKSLYRCANIIYNPEG